jgi:hypothetical protein
MCDYSLHTNPNRLATEGEDLIVYRFPTHSLGLASPADAKQMTCSAKGDKKSWWATLKEWFSEGRVEMSVCAVCIPPGAQLVLKDIPQNLQTELGVRTEERVLFTQLNACAYAYRDAVEFTNGKVVLLQRLQSGQRVRVVSLAGTDAVEPVVEEFAFQRR